MKFPDTMTREEMARFIKESVLAGLIISTREPLQIHRKERTISQLQFTQTDAWMASRGLRDIIFYEDEEYMTEYWWMRSYQEWGRPQLKSSDGIPT